MPDGRLQEINMRDLRTNALPLDPEFCDFDVPQATLTYHADGEQVITLRDQRELYGSMTLPRSALEVRFVPTPSDDHPADVQTQTMDPARKAANPISTELAARMSKTIEAEKRALADDTAKLDVVVPQEPQSKKRFGRIRANIGNKILKATVATKTYIGEKLERTTDHVRQSRKAKIAIGVGAIIAGGFVAYKVGSGLLDSTHHGNNVAQPSLGNPKPGPLDNFSPEQLNAFRRMCEHPEDFNRMVSWANANPGADLNKALDFASNMPRGVA